MFSIVTMPEWFNDVMVLEHLPTRCGGLFSPYLHQYMLSFREALILILNILFEKDEKNIVFIIQITQSASL